MEPEEFLNFDIDILVKMRTQVVFNGMLVRMGGFYHSLAILSIIISVNMLLQSLYINVYIEEL